MCRIACTAASQPPSWPAHNWSGSAASSTSPPMIFKMVFAMILLGTSPTPIGLTPGHLLSGMRREAINALSPSGLTVVLYSNVRLTPASAVHELLEADLKEEQSLFQAYASRPEGPAAPWVCRAVCLMASASRPLNKMGLTGSGSPLRREQASGSLPKGCFSFSISLVDRYIDSPSSVV